MKRIALMVALLGAAAATVVTTAGASGTRSYQAELFNAFGLVKGAELRVAGVKAGTITDLSITPQKTALVSFDVNSNFPVFKADASCSSEPQSLIAEYFLDCQPGTSPQPLQGPIPAARNKTTVQTDLVQNTLREPFKERLQLLINEFGTALTGNAENLNAAIRAGAPALQQLKQVLNILGQQNRTIAELNTNSDAIFAQLVARKEDLVRFIDNAGRTSAISAERRVDLAKNFNLLDNFLAELKPVMSQLGKLALNQTPLLTDLQAAAPGLNKLATNLPAFNDGTRLSLQSLGNAAAIGKVALLNGRPEIQALNQASTKAFPAADIVAKFLESISNPSNAVEEDSCARWDLRQQPGEANQRVALLNQKLGTTLHGNQTAPCPWPNTGQPGPNPTGGNPGYTGMEGLLNYAYIQANSLNLFDQLGHALHFTLINAPGSNPCASYQAGPSVPAKGGGTTTNPKNFAECAGILGDKQPGINYGTNPSGLFGHLPPYDPRVCPNPYGNISPSINSICDPNGQQHSTLHTAAQTQPQQQNQQSQSPGSLLPPLDPNALPQKVKDQIRKALGLGPNAPLPNPLPPGITPNGVTAHGPASNGVTPNSAATPTPSATNNLLNFLFGP